jgi:hypothetical protein
MTTTQTKLEWETSPAGGQQTVLAEAERRLLLTVSREATSQSWTSSIHELHHDGRPPTLRFLSAAPDEPEVKARTMAAAARLFRTTAP